MTGFSFFFFSFNGECAVTLLFRYRIKGSKKKLTVNTFAAILTTFPSLSGRNERNEVRASLQLRSPEFLFILCTAIRLLYIKTRRSKDVKSRFGLLFPSV